MNQPPTMRRSCHTSLIPAPIIIIPRKGSLRFVEGSALETALKKSGITSVGKKIAPRNMNMKKTIMDTMLALRAARMMAVSANPRQESTMPLPSMPARARRSFQKSRLFLRFWEIVSTLFFSGLPIYLQVWGLSLSTLFPMGLLRLTSSASQRHTTRYCV